MHSEMCDHGAYVADIKRRWLPADLGSRSWHTVACKMVTTERSGACKSPALCRVSTCSIGTEQAEQLSTLNGEVAALH